MILPALLGLLLLSAVSAADVLQADPQECLSDLASVWGGTAPHALESTFFALGSHFPPARRARVSCAVA